MYPSDTSFIQRDPILPTGVVTVEVNSEGQPTLASSFELQT